MCGEGCVHTWQKGRLHTLSPFLFSFLWCWGLNLVLEYAR